MIEHGRKARLTVTMERELVHRLDELAKLRGGSVSSIVEQCVAKHVGYLELVARACQEPLMDRLVAELMKPENLERAARIVGEEPEKDLMALREEVIKAAGEHKVR